MPDKIFIATSLPDLNIRKSETRKTQYSGSKKNIPLIPSKPYCSIVAPPEFPLNYIPVIEDIP